MFHVEHSIRIRIGSVMIVTLQPAPRIRYGMAGRAHRSSGLRHRCGGVASRRPDLAGFYRPGA
ncbi:hypothetical protein C2U72_16610 [Prosthecomicrobium hirschii]|nr:hypothetical protein C2U72_16610 [Prosthecomicrobium hirschii]